MRPPPGASLGLPVQAEGSALWGRPGARLDLEDPCTAVSVFFALAVFSCLINNNLGLILSFHFDANLFYF